MKATKPLSRLARKLQRRWALELLARDLMNANGLRDWRLGDLTLPAGQKIGDCAGMAGCCVHPTAKTSAAIYLALDFVSKMPLAFQRDVVIHEISHALAPPKERHGEVWARIAERLGIRPAVLVLNLIGAKNAAHRCHLKRAEAQATAALKDRCDRLSKSQYNFVMHYRFRGW